MEEIIMGLRQVSGGGAVPSDRLAAGVHWFVVGPSSLFLIMRTCFLRASAVPGSALGHSVLTAPGSRG